MIAGTFPLLWVAEQCGFRLGEADEVDGQHDDLPSGPVLIPQRSAGAPPERYYHPDVEEPKLFLRFASLRPENADAILAFAGRYGFLGLDRTRTRGVGPVRAYDTVCEGLADWAAEIVGLRHAVDVHDLLRRGDRAGLARFVDLKDTVGGPFWWFRTPFGWDPALDRLCFPGSPPTPDARWQPVRTNDPSAGDDPRCVARAWLAREITERLSGRVEVRFGPNPRRPGDPPGFQLCPHGLLALMWLQFARSVAGNRAYRVCRACGELFELKAQDKGRRVFCGVPCKLRDYRRRQARALELRAAGRTPKEIAAEVETELATVKRWVGSKGTKAKRRGGE